MSFSNIEYNLHMDFYDFIRERGVYERDHTLIYQKLNAEVLMFSHLFYFHRPDLINKTDDKI